MICKNIHSYCVQGESCKLLGECVFAHAFFKDAMLVTLERLRKAEGLRGVLHLMHENVDRTYVLPNGGGWIEKIYPGKFNYSKPYPYVKPKTIKQILDAKSKKQKITVKERHKAGLSGKQMFYKAPEGLDSLSKKMFFERMIRQADLDTENGFIPDRSHIHINFHIQ